MFWRQNAESFDLQLNLQGPPPESIVNVDRYQTVYFFADGFLTIRLAVHGDIYIDHGSFLR